MLKQEAEYRLLPADAAVGAVQGPTFQDVENVVCGNQAHIDDEYDDGEANRNGGLSFHKNAIHRTGQKEEVQHQKRVVSISRQQMDPEQHGIAGVNPNAGFLHDGQACHASRPQEQCHWKWDSEIFDSIRRKRAMGLHALCLCNFRAGAGNDGNIAVFDHFHEFYYQSE